LTKLMTAMVAADLAPLDTVVTVPLAATQVEPNHMGISAGEKLTLRELLDGLLLDSGNDAAEAIAMGLVDGATFIRFMNQNPAPPDTAWRPRPPATGGPWWWSCWAARSISPTPPPCWTSGSGIR